MPTLPTPPYEIDPTLPVDEWVLRGWAMITNTTTFNMTGHPALTMPTSKVDGLPAGTMLVGPHLSDGELLRIAAAYENRFGWEPRRRRHHGRLTQRRRYGSARTAPPSTCSALPVMYDDAGESKKAAARANSSGWP